MSEFIDIFLKVKFDLVPELLEEKTVKLSGPGDPSLFDSITTE